MKKIDEANAAKITGMFLEQPMEFINNVLCNDEVLGDMVRQAQEALVSENK